MKRYYLQSIALVIINHQKLNTSCKFPKKISKKLETILQQILERYLLTFYSIDYNHRKLNASCDKQGYFK